MKLWVIGKYVDSNALGSIWDFIGVVETEEEAIKACKGHPEYFIGPAILGEIVPDERQDLPGGYYPSI